MAEKTKLSSTWVIEETAFGVDPDSGGTTYKYLHAIAGIPKIGNEIIANDLQNDRLVQAAPDVGVPQASFDLEIPIRASGTPSAPPSTPAIAPEVDVLLKHILGTVTRGQSSTVTAGGTGANVNVTSSTGFIVGGLVYASQDGKLYIVKTIPNGTSLTVEPAPGSPLTSGNLVAANYYTTADTGHKSLAFVRKIGSTIWTFLGCKLTSPKIDGLGGPRATLKCTVEADSYVVGGKASLPAADDLFPTVKAPIVKGAYLWLDGVATLVGGLDLDFGTKVDWQDGIGTGLATNRAAMEVVDRNVKGSVEPYYASSYLTDFQAATARRLAFAVGTTGNGFGFYVPVANFTAYELGDKDGQLSTKLGWQASDNGAASEIVVSVF